MQDHNVSSARTDSDATSRPLRPLQYRIAGPLPESWTRVTGGKTRIWSDAGVGRPRRSDRCGRADLPKLEIVAALRQPEGGVPWPSSVGSARSRRRPSSRSSCDAGQPAEFTSIAMDAGPTGRTVRSTSVAAARRATMATTRRPTRSTGRSGVRASRSTTFCPSRTRAQILEAWRHEYNHDRPHSRLHDLSPAQFRAREQFTPDRTTRLS